MILLMHEYLLMQKLISPYHSIREHSTLTEREAHRQHGE